MEHKILKHEKNPFMHREEITVELKSDKNPSFDEVKKAIGHESELAIVKSIRGNFGRNVFTAEVFVYNSKEAKQGVEKIPAKIRKKMAEEAKKAAESSAQGGAA